MEPPVLHGKNNYYEWKVKMEHYIKAVIGIDAWISIRMGWRSPMYMYGFSEDEWTDSDWKKCEYNSKALNAIFFAVGPEQFQHIADCGDARGAWEKLKALYG